MKRSMAQLRALLPVLAIALMTTRTVGQEIPKEKEWAAGTEKAAARADPAVIAKLIQQLASADFEMRDKASQQLATLDEVPDALRDAAKSADAEVRRRAQIAMAIVTARVEEKAYQAMVRDLHKVELDRFVRRMVTDDAFAGEKQWEIIQTIARAVTKEANRLGERKFKVPEFDVKTMRQLLLSGEIKNPTSVDASVVLSAGPTPYITCVSSSIVIVDGDFTGATAIDNCLLIVRGNVGSVGSVTGSIIIATGSFVGATGCDDSFLQVNNHRIRFTVANNSVLMKTMVKTTGKTTSRVLDAERGPLQLLKFSPRKSDDRLVWGKPDNNLVVAITPADQKDQFLIRWKNVGRDALELPWGRLNVRSIFKDRDDLLNHVFLKGPDGKLVEARKHAATQVDRAPFFGRSVVLGPGGTHEETINLWTYVDRPAAHGRYQLSIELDIPNGARGREWEVKAWSGKIQSNALDVRFGK